MNKKGKKILFEDLADSVQYQNKWTGAHQMAQRKGTEQMTIMDIIAKDRALNKKSAQHPNNAQAPAPELVGESPLLVLLGDMMVQNEGVKKVIRKVHESPVLEDNTKAKAKLNAIMTKLVAIDNVVKKVAEDIDSFKVEITEN